MESEQRQERLAQVHTVLLRTLVLNLTVCVIKVIVGLMTGMVAIVADGIHTLGDSLSNVIGMLGIRYARRPPDKQYPYGYDKFETIATLVIASVISISFVEVVKLGFKHLMNPHPVQMHPAVFAAIVATMVINYGIVRYEHGQAMRLQSELLHADADETKSDLYLSGGVLLSALLINYGLWWADGVMTLIISLAILRIIYNVIVSAAKVLADARVVDPREVHDIVMTVPGTRFCHAIRSRGRSTGFFLDLHLGISPDMSIEMAHDVICHEVKVALREHFPALRSANIHIEPDHESGRDRRNSVFRHRDPYDH